MFNALLRLGLAALICFGIAAYVTEGDFSQVSRAFETASSEASARKRDRIAAKEAAAEQPAEKADSATRVVTKRSFAQPMQSEIVMTGATEASRRVEVRAETSGMVASTIPKGTRVNAGDVLCRMKVGDRAARREAAVARFKQARVDEQAQARLSERGFAAANNASQARTSADVIRAEIKQLDVEIRRLEITAPFGGVIEGETAEIGSILQVGGVCATLVDPDPLKVVGFAPEFRVGEIDLGSPGTATLATGQTVSGTVDFIAQTADPSTRTFQVELAVPNPSYALRDEVTAVMTLPVGTTLAHALPQSTLTLDEDGEIGVMIAVDGTARFRRVEVLRNDKDGVRLTGLGDEAEVIVIGQEYISDGTTIDTTPANETELDNAS